MGRKPDVEMANFLARQAELQARREASPALSSEWRWSRSGWGDWGADRKRPEAEPAGLPQDRDAPSAGADDAADD
jgi:hypothetical protein